MRPPVWLLNVLGYVPAGRRAVAWQAVKFAMVGFVNLAVDFGIFFLALTFLTGSLVAANVLAWCVAVSGSYVLNSFITFATESGRRLRLRAYAAFVASQVTGLLAGTTTLVVAATVMPVLGAKVAATLVGFLVNFSLARLLVFRRRHPLPDERGG